MTALPFNDYIMAHCRMHKGTYLDAVSDIGNGMYFAHSYRIDDFYWNFAFGLSVSLRELPEAIQSLREFSKSIHRRPTLYVTPDTKPIGIADVLSHEQAENEIWMVFNRPTVELKRRTYPGLEMVRIERNPPSPDFLSVFADAYGNGPEGSPGYVGLPDNYKIAIRDSSSREGVWCAHFVGSINRRPAAIASVYCDPPLAGLYNVGTSHDSRRLGLGWELSVVATDYALSNGCKSVFLQTLPDSPVEALYHGIGYRRLFQGTFLVL